MDIKKLVKTFLIVLMIVLLVIPKSLAVELGNMIKDVETKKVDEDDVTETPDGNNKTEDPAINDGTETPDENNKTEDPVINDGTETPDGNNKTEDPAINDGTETPDGNNKTEDPAINDGTETSDGNDKTEDPAINDGTETSDGNDKTEAPAINDVTDTVVLKKKATVKTVADGLVLNNGIWQYIKNGQVDYTYTGFANNEFGMWYVEKGIITFKYNGPATDNSGDTWIIKKSKVDSELTDVMEVNGIWRMVINGKVEKNYTGIGKNTNGEWYIQNGTIDFRYTGSYTEGDKTYIIEKSRVIATLNGNLSEGLVLINGVWRMVKDGKIDNTYTGFANNEYGIWYVEKGTITFQYNGAATDEDGNIWVIKKSKVESDLTKVMEVNGIWRMVINGKVEKNYTGIGKNENGEWYIQNGTIDFRYTGPYTDGEKTYLIEKARVIATLNSNLSEEVVLINGVWRMVRNGQIDYNYTGFGNNEHGKWYVEAGKVTFQYNGVATDEDGNTWIIKGSKVESDLTKVMEVNGIWRMVINGKVEKNYTGIGKNENGEWYIQNGTIDFRYTGEYTEGDKTYIIEKSLVVKVISASTTKVTKIAAKKMEQSSTYYCEENNVVGTIIATNIDGEDLTSRLTNLVCEIIGSYEIEGITDANSGATVKVELNKQTGKYEIKLNTAYPGAYTITPNATGDIVSTTLEKESITVIVEDKTTTNKIKLIDKSTGKELENNTLELYSNKNNNYGIKVEFYHSYNNGREVLLPKTAEEVTLEKVGEIFTEYTTLGDAYESPATGKNKVENLHVAITEVSEEKTGTLTIKAEGAEVVITVKAKPVKIERLKVNNDTTTIELPIAEGSSLEIPIELLDELGGKKTISSDMIVKTPSQSQNGNIAIYIANSQYSAMTAGFIKMTYKPNSNDITSIVFELTAPAKTKAKEVFSQGIVFEFDSSRSETGRDKVILMPTNL